jgi:excisionase family DNA binding protein
MTIAQYKRWLKGRLDYLLEWEAVGWNPDVYDDEIIDEAREHALRLHLPAIAAKCQHTKRVSESAELLATILAELNKGDWIEMQEAARIMGCSVSGLRKLIKRDAIRYAQSGKHGRIRFRREWLEISPPAYPRIHSPSRAVLRKPRTTASSGHGTPGANCPLVAPRFQS